MVSQGAKTVNTSSTVRLERTVRSLSVTPHRALIGFWTQCHKAEPGGPHGYTVKPVRRPLFGVTKNDYEKKMWFLSALEPAVRAKLAQAGCANETRWIAEPLLALHAPDLGQLEELGVLDVPLFDLVQQYDQGLARINHAMVNPALLIAELVLAHANLSFAVAVARESEARLLTNQLQHYLPSSLVTRVVGNDHPAHVSRVAVGTYIGLGHGPVAMEQRDFLVYPNALEAISVNGTMPFAHAYRARVYGFLDKYAKPTQFEMDRMRCLFGFAEASVPRHNHRERLVQVEQSLTVKSVLPITRMDVFTLRQQGIHRHQVRNWLIVKSAKQHVARLAGTGMRVVVLVDTIEHGLALAEQLHWPLIADPDCNTEDLFNRSKRLIQESYAARFEDWPGAVVTNLGLESIHLEQVRVVVRADGGAGLPALDENKLIERNDQPSQPLLIVDANDRHHPQLRKWTGSRRQAYAKRGWYAQGIDPVEARVQMFLDCRPRGHDVSERKYSDGSVRERVEVAS